ncbi:MAG: response regulator [Desulfobulbaceae bacterium]|nr:MAG: response regulator [Desulfobulbaceae bacterium]
MFRISLNSMNSVKAFLLFLVLLIPNVPLPLAAGQTLFKHNVLIIHSYHKDMQWVEEVHRGIEKELLAALGTAVDIKVEYMDSKRYVGPDYYQMLASLWKYKYENTTLDCLIVCDDNALNLALALRDDLFKGVPMVFCGINFYDQKRFGSIPNITGVIEAYDIGGTLELIKQLMPQRNRLYIINDKTTTGQANKERIEAIAFDYLDHFNFMYSGKMSTATLQNVVKNLTEDTAILLMSFNRDAEENILRYRDAIHAIRSVSPSPIFGVWSFYLGKGIVGGSLVNGDGQGRKAAELCLQILGGTAPSELPIIQTSPNLPMFDYNEMQRFGIIDKKLPSGAVVINAPNSVWHRYKWSILSGVSLLIFQFLIITMLVKANRRRKASEQNLRRNQQNLAITLAAIGEGVISVNSDLQIVRANPSAAKLLETPLHELGGLNLAELLHSLDKVNGPGIGDVVAKCCETGTTIDLDENTMLHIKGGKEKNISGTCSAIRDQDESILGAVLICHDITEKRAMQTMLAQSQKMEAIGQLAGGVAHDFNNLLTGISGFAELLSIQLQDDHKKNENAVKILNAASRAKDLTRQLLSFARRGKIFSSPVDCHEPILSVLSLLERSIHKNIRLRKNLNAECSTIMGDAVQLENILLNLGINSADAMETGGSLSFSTTNEVLTTPLISEFGEPVEPGTYVRICVTDSGCGIDREIRQLIFEPFYTSKVNGKGTGLGLSAVYGAMKEHDGRIVLVSEPDKGTEFQLYFPVVKAPQSGQRSESVPVQRGSETILVIDDEQLILSAAEGLLTELGFTVLLAEGGENGLHIYRQQAAEIDIVLLDMMMPEMDGAECFGELKKINPEVVVVISSGFAKTSRVEEVERQGVAGFLQKPYTAREVSATIHQVLGRSG